MSAAVATATSPENEITIYAEITDQTGLLQAQSKVLHEQYELKPKTNKLPDGSFEPSMGKIRVRKLTAGDLVTYEQTVKLSTGNGSVDSNMEYTIPIDAEYFEAFKKICSSGMIKTRYTFPIEKVVLAGIDDGHTDLSFPVKKKDACYEVDVFSSPEGDTYSWCKIDLELDAITDIAFDHISDDTKLKITAKVSSLPIKLKNMFIGKSATEYQKKLMDYLYEHMFTVKIVKA